MPYAYFHNMLLSDSLSLSLVPAHLSLSHTQLTYCECVFRMKQLDNMKPLGMHSIGNVRAVFVYSSINN